MDTNAPLGTPENGIKIKGKDLKALQKVSSRFSGGGCHTCRYMFLFSILVFLGALILLILSQFGVFSLRPSAQPELPETKLLTGDDAQLRFEDETILQERLHKNVKAIDEKKSLELDPEPE